jgi:hypothetical protein
MSREIQKFRRTGFVEGGESLKRPNLLKAPPSGSKESDQDGNGNDRLTPNTASCARHKITLLEDRLPSVSVSGYRLVEFYPRTAICL